MNETIINNELQNWLKRSFMHDSSYLMKKEVNFKLNDFKFRADLIAIQSKSNIIHGFEIKNNINQSNIQSTISQVYSYYTNYKWLVVQKDKIIYFDKSILEKISNFGIGIIVFENDAKEFKIWKESKYIDGNFLKFIPEMQSEWENKTRTSKI